MTEIMVFGTSGVGKTTFVELIAERAKRHNYRVAVSDHELFEQRRDYAEKLVEVRQLHESKEVDISLLVVNDGRSSLRIDFGGQLHYKMAPLLFG